MNRTRLALPLLGSWLSLAALAACSEDANPRNDNTSDDTADSGQQGDADASGDTTVVPDSAEDSSTDPDDTSDDSGSDSSDDSDGSGDPDSGDDTDATADTDDGGGDDTDGGGDADTVDEVDSSDDTDAGGSPTYPLVITEIMKDPCTVADSSGEWFEVVNVGDAPVDLRGITIRDDGRDNHVITGAAALLAEPGVPFVLGSSADVATNGGVTVDYVYASLLLANGDDAIVLVAPNGSAIDAVRYTRDAFPNVACVSMSLDLDAQSAEGNDDGARWCSATTSYNSRDFGTPGSANLACASAPGLAVCRLAAPLDVEARPGDAVGYQALLSIPGLTDTTTGVDANPLVLAQAGYGAPGTTPDLTWTWSAAAGDVAWSDATASGFDRYVASVVAPASGSYDAAVRVSVDGGRTWTACDRSVEGSDGSADGYQPANAGRLRVLSACEPNPCTTPPAATCNAAGTAIVTSSEGTCSVVSGRASCSYPTSETPCDPADVCRDGVCVPRPPAPSLPGDVLVTELLPQSTSGTDNGEWVELYNTTANPLQLRDCVLGDAGTDAHTINADLTVPARGFVVLARSADPVANHGLTFNYVYSGFTLRNSGDTVQLTCGGTVIDAYTYPAAQVSLGVSIQLDVDRFDPLANDTADNWCPARATYGTAAKLGTPGLANRSCAPDPLTLGWCRLQAPASLVVTEGAPATWTGRLWVDGFTSLTPGIDGYSRLRAQVGYAANEFDPRTAPAEWTWFDAAGTPRWDGAAAGEPNNDQYEATFDAPASSPQPYAVAFRFSGDSGNSWLYCDLNVGAGSDGAQDGFQLGNAGVLTSLSAAICAPNPCSTPPANACADSVTTLEYAATGECAPQADSTPLCTYATTGQNCLLTEQVCQAGGCVEAAPTPAAAGDLVFTEIMAASASGSGDRGEWFEIHNPGTSPLDLSRCAVGDGAAEVHDIAGPLVIGAGDYLVLARSADPVENRGVNPDYVYRDVTLGNSADTLLITCDGVEIDRVAWTSGFVTIGYASNLDEARINGVDNDLQDNWCAARSTYGTGLYGTPGAANTTCAPIVYSNIWCRLQWPTSTAATEGNLLDVYGRVFVAGLTDLTGGNDPAPGLVAQVGYGAFSSNPASAPGWSWFNAAPNPTWVSAAFGEPGNDEYLGTLTVPPFVAPSLVVDYAFRFSGDGGTTWTYCDVDAGAGSDGAENGYQPELAGKLSVLSADVCVPNPCTTPPADTCLDAGTARQWSPGVCSNNGAGAPVCAYNPVDVACDADQACDAGACVDSIFAPTSRGDLYISEIMAQSRSGSDPGEWFELRNRGTTPYNLEGCVISDASGASDTIDTVTVIAPGQTILLARSADEVALLGATAAFEYSGINLNNGGDSIAITCGGLVIDEANYLRSTLGAATQLSPRFAGPDTNDDLLNWCDSPAVLDLGLLFGSPGQVNPPCANDPLAIGWCRLQWPFAFSGPAGGLFDVYGRLYVAGLTELTPGIDASPKIVAEAGYGPAGSPASDAAWQWTRGAANGGYNGLAGSGEANNDEYFATLTIPTGSTFDFAFRFSGDSGATWTYCDLNAGPGSDGAEDGYQPGNAGELTVTNACTSAPPCNEPPADTCLSGTSLARYPAAGACVDNAGTAVCLYEPTTVDCAALGNVCVAGACVPASPAVPVGSVIFSELLTRGSAYTPDDPADAQEFVELKNTSATAVNLAGCTLTFVESLANSPSVTLPSGSTVPALGYLAVYPGSSATVPSPFVKVAGMRIPDGTTAVSLACGATTVDLGVVPAAWAGVSMQLQPSAGDGVANDDAVNWCGSSTRYGGALLGTPSTANTPCIGESLTSGVWCRLQWPLDQVSNEGEIVTYYGRVYVGGVTEQSTGTDPDPRVRVKWGFGPDGSTPSASWTWYEAVPNPGYFSNLGGEPNNDEYYVSAPVPALAGEILDHAFALSIDRGATWTYCDRAAFDGDGAANGYQPANAGALLPQ
jgi:hypothetical protein